LAVTKKIEGIRVHVRMTARQHEMLKHFASRGGYSVSETLRRAIDEFLATKYRKG
jgi:predicted O-methyltransferase YrrM